MSRLTMLHTSDWHLGHQLYRKRRDEEFQDFLNWLANAIEVNHVDHLLITGDVFDNAAPGTNAQRMYYEFLINAARAGARSIIITAGNHDSPAFLTAPRELLSVLKVYVIGAISGNLEDEIIVLRDSDGQPEAIVCAVPYLREKDARSPKPGESIEEKERDLAEGISAHYADIAELAEAMRAGRDIPVIVTGHLYTTGAATGDGVRDLYIGSLGHVPASIFSDTFDYVALGHIHKPQQVGASETVRYSGSPLPMSFDEARQTKSSVIIRFNGRTANVELLPTPEFRKFLSLRGSRAAILEQLRALATQQDDSGREIWVEIEHDGSDQLGDLRQEALELMRNSRAEILCVRACRPGTGGQTDQPNRSLENLQPRDIFMQRLEQQNVTGKEREEMLDAFAGLEALWNETQREAEE